ncbi:basic proline-rich protein-like [Antechinus flavipes]|uniref:basic proline-rich protein-like n=1 Tax=Antechinus flavipes TaxID=38775 RepID=UPI002235771B|nr:basic proline-rich protein-like [Antechinus flavipes]
MCPGEGAPLPQSAPQHGHARNPSQSAQSRSASSDSAQSVDRATEPRAAPPHLLPARQYLSARGATRRSILKPGVRGPKLSQARAGGRDRAGLAAPALQPQPPPISKRPAAPGTASDAHPPSGVTLSPPVRPRPPRPHPVAATAPPLRLPLGTPPYMPAPLGLPHVPAPLGLPHHPEVSRRIWSPSTAPLC